jgi:hypothetical protein
MVRNTERPSAGKVRHWSGALLALRFLSEVALLAVLAVAGARLGTGPLTKIGLALLGPLVAVLIWGVFVAPESRNRLPDPVRLVVEIAVFAGSSIVLALVGFPVPGVIFGVVAVAAALLLRRYAPKA